MQVFRRKVECKRKGSSYLALTTICKDEKGMHGGIDWGKQKNYNKQSRKPTILIVG